MNNIFINVPQLPIAPQQDSQASYLEPYLTDQAIENFLINVVQRHTEFYNSLADQMNQQLELYRYNIQQRRIALGAVSHRCVDKQLLDDIISTLYYVDISRVSYKSIRLDELMVRQRKNNSSKNMGQTNNKVKPTYYIGGSNPKNHSQLCQVCMYMYLTHKNDIDLLTDKNKKKWALTMFLYKYVATYVFNKRSYNTEDSEIVDPIRYKDIKIAVNDTLRRISLGDTTIRDYKGIILAMSNNREKTDQSQKMKLVISEYTLQLKRKPTREELLQHFKYTPDLLNFYPWACKDHRSAYKYLGQLIKRYELSDYISMDESTTDNPDSTKTKYGVPPKLSMDGPNDETSPNS